VVVLYAISIFALAQYVSREKADTDYSTSTSFNIASLMVTGILVALYTVFW
jgi:hypothetical protein